MQVDKGRFAPMSAVQDLALRFHWFRWSCETLSVGQAIPAGVGIPKRALEPGFPKAWSHGIDGHNHLKSYIQFMGTLENQDFSS